MYDGTVVCGLQERFEYHLEPWRSGFRFVKLKILEIFFKESVQALVAALFVLSLVEGELR